MRLLLAAILCCLGLSYAAETSTAINYDVRQSGFKFNDATQIALTSTEQNVVFTTQPGHQVFVQFAPPSSSGNTWTYSLTSGDSTKTTTVASGQTVKLRIGNGDTVYLKSASGVTISISCLYDEKIQQ